MRCEAHVATAPGGRVSSDWLCAHLDLPLKVITTKVIGSTASLGDQQYLLVIG